MASAATPRAFASPAGWFNPLGSFAYCVTLRLRALYFAATLLAVVLPIGLSGALQLNFSFFADSEAEVLQDTFVMMTKTTIASISFFFMAVVTDVVTIIAWDCFTNAPLATARARLITCLRLERRQKLALGVDWGIVASLEVVPVLGSFVGIWLGFQQGFLTGFVLGGSFWAFLVSIVQTLASISCRVQGLGAKSDDVRELLNESTAYTALEKIPNVADDVRSRPARAASCLAIAPVSMLFVAVVPRDSTLFLMAATLCPALSMLLVAKAWHYLVPRSIGRSFWFLVLMYVPIALSMLLGSKSSASAEMGGTVPSVPFEGRGRFQRSKEMSNEYPLCHTLWGKAGQPEYKRLTSLDMYVFASALYLDGEPDVRRYVSAGFAGTEFGDVHALELASIDTVGRWGVFDMPSARVRVVAIRGTFTLQDLIADALLWAPIHVFQTFSKLIPVLAILPDDAVQSLLDNFILRSIGGYEPTLHRIADVVSREADDCAARGCQVLVTGHSLGGTLAIMAASRADVPALAWSPMGFVYSAKRFGIDLRSVMRNVVIAWPAYDLVPTIDKVTGSVNHIGCSSSRYDKCHSMHRMGCEIYSSCGDRWGRVLRSCDMFEK
eukprot:TRINITY_DN19063_c0_g1_i1.p1 TRINITY_DN19063_c0_g1~~TRINITY_DN19063_c0_g1_i1.p1  ORF type:complete len:609 (-),score=50.87 TRINITY_DN19063_c0_g1_i1:57-1883(-)